MANSQMSLLFLYTMIEPTPALFYSIVSEAFGANAVFATRVINKVQLVSGDNKQIQTLEVGKDGIIWVNEKFWKERIKTRLDAKIVLLHELFHVVTGDTLKLESMTKSEHEIANISMDMRINAAICQCFLASQFSLLSNSVLCKMYPAGGIIGLLRPLSAYGKNSKYKLIYSSLYENANTGNTLNKDQLARAKEMFKSEEAIRAALKILIPRDQRESTRAIIFIGSHGGEGVGRPQDKDQDNKQEIEEIDIGDLDEGIKQEIRNAIQQQVEETAKQGGLSDILAEHMVHVIQTNKSIAMRALEQFACNAKINEIKAFYRKERRKSSVVPIQPSSRDIAMLAVGLPPAIWHNRSQVKKNINKNVAIYIDVSGSVTHWLPKLMGLVKNLDKGVKQIFAFSTEVHDHSVEEMSSGIYKTTGGTDFDCIVTHAFERDINKIIIFTDGYADVRQHDKTEIRKRIKDVAIVYFGDGVNKDNFFQKEYDKGFDIKELL